MAQDKGDTSVVSKNPEVVDVTASICGETDKALKLYDGSRKEWVAKQHVEDNADGTFTMPFWLAKEKGFI